MTSVKSVDRTAVRQFVDQVKAAGGTYHRLDLGDGLVIDGDYDMTQYVGHYHLPERLGGTSVLDVGTAAGFFAIECARRGGSVTAIDIGDQTCLVAQLVRILGLDVRYLQHSIYELEPAFGRFDLVVCGSLLLHLPDPMGALRALRSVTRKRLVISTASTFDSETTSLPVCYFEGQHAEDGDYWTYWTLSAAAMCKMLLAAGFARVDQVEHFNLRSQPHRTPYATPHVVMSAYV